MKKELVSKLQNYIGEEGISHEDVDMGESTIEDIKTDMIKLSQYFILIFDEFRYNFIDCNDKEVNELIENTKEVALEIISLSQYSKSNMAFGSSESIEKLIDYIKFKYYLLVDFCNLYNEVFE